VAITAAAGMLAAGLGAAGLGAAVPAAAAGPAEVKPGSISWGKCSDPFLKQAKAQCGLLSVPLNYADPTGPTIRIGVSRILHTSSARNYQGVILTNPGGPGGSGLDLNVFLVDALKSEHLGAAAADYDWIGFDPRGVGSSVPALTCEPNYFRGDRKNYDPATTRLLSYWLSRTKRYDMACESHSAAQAALLKNMTTVDAATDMDSIRAALGAAKITYYGFSYGTYLGQVYATRFASHVRRIILDSNVDPRNVWYKANLNQDVAFNRNVNIWFGWLAKYERVFGLGRTEKAVQDRFYAEKNRLAGHPVSGQVGPDEWTDIFLDAGYFQETWVQLGKAFANWAHGHHAQAGQAIVTLFKETDTPGNDNEFAVYNAVQCTDVQWPRSWARWSTDNRRVNRKAPFETWDNAWFNAPCLYWPAPASTPTKVASGGSGAEISSALLIDQTLDAATPFEGSREVRKLFPHSVLLAEPGGTTHADSLDGNLCVDRTIARYLETGKLPARKPHARWDKTCAPLPRPVPTKSALADAAGSTYQKVLSQLRGRFPARPAS
jgi:pimeloyl-ACP methyl ester carboxylesterase